MEEITKLTEKLIELRRDESTPTWAKVLIQCVSELVGIVNENDNLNKRLVVLEDVNKVRGAVIDQLQEEIKYLKRDLEQVRQSTDNNEQKSRSSCLLIHGVDENDDEDTDKICLAVVNDDVGVDLSLGEIGRSHRIGPKRPPTRNSKPRPIIFRFSSMRKRMEVYRNKKELKGKNIVITESLTKIRYQLLLKAKSKYGVRNVWTTEGRIFTKVGNKLKQISSFDDVK